jgi:hypothetical protein
MHEIKDTMPTGIYPCGNTRPRDFCLRRGTNFQARVTAHLHKFLKMRDFILGGHLFKDSGVERVEPKDNGFHRKG